MVRDALRAPHHEGFSNATELASHDPEREHGDADRDELQHHAKTHQPLRRIRRSAPHHIDETHQQDKSDGADRDGKKYLAQKGSHYGYITPACALRHAAVRGFGRTIWLFMA